MKKILLTVFCIFSVALVSAQQDPQLSQYFFNKAVFNPAVTGVDEMFSATAFYRSQWVGFDGGPETQTVSVGLPIYAISSGVGAYFVNQQTGFERNMSLKLNYSYIMEIGRGQLAAGASVGMMQRSLDGAKLRSPEGYYEDPTVNHNDNYIPNMKVSGFRPDAGIGVFFTINNIKAGAAVNHLLEPVVSFPVGNTTSEMRYRRHLYVHGEYGIRLTDKLELNPSIMLKSDLTEHQIDTDVYVVYNENFWGGLGFRGYNDRSFDAIIGMVGFRLAQNLRFGYSYDYTISGLGAVNSGSHEVFLNYQVPVLRPSGGKIIHNPRFLSY